MITLEKAKELLGVTDLPGDPQEIEEMLQSTERLIHKTASSGSGTTGDGSPGNGSGLCSTANSISSPIKETPLQH